MSGSWGLLCRFRPSRDLCARDADKIAVLRRGELPIYEPGLDDLVAGNVRAQRLSFTTDLKGAVAEADAVFIAVGTPSRLVPSCRGDGHADLSCVYVAAREIAAALDGFTVVITRSTIPVNTGLDILAEPLILLGVKRNLRVK
jgi:UDPglucose 6-dehydrogenase